MSGKKTESAVTVSSLPVYVLSIVLSFCSQTDIVNAAAVCKTFHDASKVPELWKRVKLNLKNPGVMAFTRSYASVHVEELDAHELTPMATSVEEYEGYQWRAWGILSFCPKVIVYTGPGDIEWMNAGHVGSDEYDERFDDD